MMDNSQYAVLLSKLLTKTLDRKAIWKKAQRDQEFRIIFGSGALVIDKYFNEEHVSVYDFAIFNDRGDNIYYSAVIDMNSDLYPTLESLHSVVTAAYFKIDETIEGFSQELDGDDVIGDDSPF